MEKEISGMNTKLHLLTENINLSTEKGKLIWNL